MKKLLVLALVLSLTMLVSASALAAVHNFTGDFYNYYLNGEGNPQFSGLSWGGWYSVDKDSAGMTARVLLPENETDLGFEYYQNDQFFVNLSNFSGDWAMPTGTSLQASYLFDFGLFVGLDYGNVEYFYPYVSTVISPGYRFSFGDNGYAAISVDYETNDEYWGDCGILDYDIDVKYFTDNAKIYGQILIPNEELTYDDEPIFELAANYKFNDNFTAGVGIFNCDEEFDFQIGVTASFDKILAELRYIGSDYGRDAVDANFLYSFTDKFTAGIQVTSVEDVDDPVLVAKIKYTIDDKQSVRLLYKFENDEVKGGGAVTYLRWDMAL